LPRWHDSAKKRNKRYRIEMEYRIRIWSENCVKLKELKNRKKNIENKKKILYNDK